MTGPEHQRLAMTLAVAPYVRIIVEGYDTETHPGAVESADARSFEDFMRSKPVDVYREDAQIIAPCPWPGIPAGHSTDLPYTDLHGWQCCDDGPAAMVLDVTLHWPAKPGDPAFTVRLSSDIACVRHLQEKHGFFPA